MFVFSRWHPDSKVEWKTIPTSRCSILLHIQSFRKHTMILTPNTPSKKLSRAKILSLSLSPSHLKEHNCLSLIKLQKKKKKKLGEFSAFRVELRGKLCIPPTTMVWYCYNWKYKNPTTAATITTTITKRNVSCVLIMHRSEWRLLHGSDLTLDSFLTMFIFVSLFCFSV